jgi:hypothetical protein
LRKKICVSRAWRGSQDEKSSGRGAVYIADGPHHRFAPNAALAHRLTAASLSFPKRVDSVGPTTQPWQAKSKSVINQDAFSFHQSNTAREGLALPPVAPRPRGRAKPIRCKLNQAAEPTWVSSWSAYGNHVVVLAHLVTPKARSSIHTLALARSSRFNFPVADHNHQRCR